MNYKRVVHDGETTIIRLSSEIVIPRLYTYIFMYIGTTLYINPTLFYLLIIRRVYETFCEMVKTRYGIFYLYVRV